MRNTRLWIYVAILLVMVSLTLVVPSVWATPDQPGAGTVPTPMTMTPTHWLYLPTMAKGATP